MTNDKELGKILKEFGLTAADIHTCKETGEDYLLLTIRSGVLLRNDWKLGIEKALDDMVITARNSLRKFRERY